jgi:HEAT repeat protein
MRWAGSGRGRPAIPAILAEMDLPPDHINYAPLAGFRRDAARSLGRMGPAAQAAVPVLGRALKNEDPVYRVEAALALWRILGGRRRSISWQR